MKNQIIRCKCVDMSVDGQGIAKADKLVVFVKGMIKGEEADVKIIAEKKNYSFGIIDKLIVRSPYRKDLDCPIAYKCGGCDYRHIDYSYQLDLKKEVLINTFPGYKVNDIICCDDPFYYRNKVQIPVADHKMGFFRKFSNDIVEFEDCLIESKIANEMIADLKKLILNTKLEPYIRHILIKHGKGSNEVML
ncbi:MAG: class I SAM-dependent RNA methyltransferase, partial [Erysipelotrichaceae bacterium]|nr:class I SAM-dependent RNA methyltransferase [Erysipelotrichaceae bacterium]